MRYFLTIPLGFLILVGASETVSAQQFQQFQPIERQMPVPSATNAPNLPQISPVENSVIAPAPPSPISLLNNEMKKTQSNLTNMATGLSSTQKEVDTRLGNIDKKIDTISGKTDVLDARIKKNEERVEAVSKAMNAQQDARNRQSEQTAARNTRNSRSHNAERIARIAHNRAAHKPRAQVIISTPDIRDSAPPVASMPTVLGN